MPRTRRNVVPNFRQAEMLYNLKEQANALYEDAMQGTQSPGQEIEVLAECCIQALVALGVTGEQIIEFVPDNQNNGVAASREVTA